MPFRISVCMTELCVPFAEDNDKSEGMVYCDWLNLYLDDIYLYKRTYWKLDSALFLFTNQLKRSDFWLIPWPTVHFGPMYSFHFVPLQCLTLHVSLLEAFVVLPITTNNLWYSRHLVVYCREFTTTLMLSSSLTCTWFMACIHVLCGGCLHLKVFCWGCFSCALVSQ